MLKNGTMQIMAFAIIFMSLGISQPADSAQVALTGVVTSQAGGPMEGVLVSAERQGGTITVTVDTDKQGRYTFPASRLFPGEYQLTIRAVGYDAAKPDMTATVTDSKTAEFNIKLDKTKDLAAQLTGAEWLSSIHGTPRQKDLFFSCVHCHSLALAVQSSQNQTEFQDTILRMRNYMTPSTLAVPIPRAHSAGSRPWDIVLAKFLSSIDLSSQAALGFSLKTFPLPSGNDTKVVITEYTIPYSDWQPHDANIDSDGMVYFTDFSSPRFGRLDPRTGKVTYREDLNKKWGYRQQGFQCMQFDSKGNPWIARHSENGIAEFDRKTGKFTNYSIPASAGANTRTSTGFLAITHDDKYVWISDDGNQVIYRLDLATGKYDRYNPFPSYHPPYSARDGLKGPKPMGHSLYGISVDSKGNCYFDDIAGGIIGKIEAQTGKTTLFHTPTVNSGPRRSHMDSQDRLWFGEYWAGNIGMFDTKTNQFHEYAVPVPWYGPYDAVMDKDGYVWTGSMASDMVLRFNPKNGTWNKYLLPRLNVNVRRVSVSNATTPPTFWAGENHQARIAKVETLQ
ncbi:MAG: virginiamycin B lyase family protein [Terriglobia bacterium]